VAKGCDPATRNDDPQPDFDLSIFGIDAIDSMQLPHAS
jgi:hypothetical protein